MCFACCFTDEIALPNFASTAWAAIHCASCGQMLQSLLPEEDSDLLDFLLHPGLESLSQCLPLLLLLLLPHLCN